MLDRILNLPGDPEGPQDDGSAYFNTTTRTLRVYDGGWRDVGKDYDGPFAALASRVEDAEGDIASQGSRIEVIEAWNADNRLKTLEQSSSPVGSIITYAGAGVIPGWLHCWGQAVSRSTYQDLFDVIGTTFGVGNGSTTFNVPDLRGKVVVNAHPQVPDFNTLGKTGGASYHTLTVDEMPSHTHTQNSHNHAQNSHRHEMGTPKWRSAESATGGTVYSPATTNTQPSVLARDTTSVTATNVAATATNQNAGGGRAHNNLQPYITLWTLIKH